MMRILLETAAAFGGTIAFSLLFGVPKRYYLNCGLAGGLGWLLYRLLGQYALWPATTSTFFAAALVALYSRIAAVRRQCPATVFLITGIFPLVPGAGIYWTAYYLVTSEINMALSSGMAAVKAAFAIVLAIVVVFELPRGLFAMLKKKAKV